MNTEPLSKLSDEELQARIERFIDLGMAADRRHDLNRDESDRLEARRCWHAACEYTRVLLWRWRVEKPATNDPGKRA